MRNPIATAVVATALTASSVFGALVLADVSQAAPVRAELGTRRALCTKIGTGELRDLWLTADGRCQSGYNFTDKAALGISGGSGGTVGPQGPKGDKGDPGASAVWYRKTTVHLTAQSPATQTVVISGVPAKSSLALELPLPQTNAASAPASAQISVTPITASAGSTERSFKVDVAGLTEPFDLVIQIFGATA